MRSACEFEPGASVADTLGFTDEIRRAIPIEHVMVMMQENRSFDSS